MSKNVEMYERWLTTAADDIEAAEWNLKGGFHNQVCFLCQQAAEKALKAFLFLQGEREAWGHSSEQLCKACAKYNEAFADLLGDLKKLDRFYIPTRYPNGVPSGTPKENYTKEDSEYGLAVVKRVFGNVKEGTE